MVLETHTHTKQAQAGSGISSFNVPCGCVHRVKSMGGVRQLQRAQPGGQGGNQKRVGRHGADRVVQASVHTLQATNTATH